MNLIINILSCLGVIISIPFIVFTMILVLIICIMAYTGEVLNDRIEV